MRVQRLVGSIIQLGLCLVPGRARAPLARLLLRVTPGQLRLSLAGRAVPALRSGDHLPILDGTLRGAKWIVDSSLHSCIAGNYEMENQELLIRHLEPGQVVFDIGANVGFFTLLASRLVGPRGKVFAFEPFPEALALLGRHLALNDVRNVTVIEAAVSEASGRASFQRHEQITMGRLADDGDVIVRVLALDDLYLGGLIPTPRLIKVDVEGEELKVLRGARMLLRGAHPVVVLSTHGSVSHRACGTLLRELGYQIEGVSDTRGVGGFDFLGELIATIPN